MIYSNFFTLITNVDCNDYRDSGIYYANNCTNSPYTYAMMQVLGNLSSDCVQIATQVGSSRTKIRSYNGSSWTDWEEVALKSDLSRKLTCITKAEDNNIVELSLPSNAGIYKVCVVIEHYDGTQHSDCSGFLFLNGSNSKLNITNGGSDLLILDLDNMVLKTTTYRSFNVICIEELVHY